LRDFTTAKMIIMTTDIANETSDFIIRELATYYVKDNVYKTAINERLAASFTTLRRFRVKVMLFMLGRLMARGATTRTRYPLPVVLDELVKRSKLT
jgi:hypothetical protein